MERVERGLWALVAAGALHVLEEFLLDWRAWAQQLSGLPLTWNRFWLVNAGFLVFACVCAASGLRRPVLATALPCLVFINGVFFHIGPTVLLGHLSPGALTSLGLYVPLSVWTMWHASRTGLLTAKVFAAGAALAAGLMAVPFVIFALA